jgi:hypothetical protein
MQKKNKYIQNIDLFVMLFIFLLLFLLPLFFTRDQNRIAMPNVIKIWQDRVLLIPLFLINHLWLVPRLVLKKKYSLYLIISVLSIFSVTVSYYFIDRPKQSLPQKDGTEVPVMPGNQVNRRQPRQQPTPVPPYADLLLFSLLIVAVDTGLSFTKYWHSSEEEKMLLENESIQAQLGMLRHQVSPHFFMNTLNNIYALVEKDNVKAREAIMKLSKLMRYMLYEKYNGKILLSKEFEFIKSYADLMKLRYVDDVSIRLRFPKKYTDVEIPMLIFISYIENAFKYGTSYQQKSEIEITFKTGPEYLQFTCINSINSSSLHEFTDGIGLQNSRKRLDLLYGEKYSLTITEKDTTYTVNLKVPLK